MDIYIIIAIFSIIQSIFGVGLLLFGTPTFLLLGFSYSETLLLLLPCSMAISLIQVVNDYKLIEAKRRAVYWIIPALILSLSLVINYKNDINITKLVGMLLLLIGAIKFSSKLQDLLSSVVKKNIQMYYIMIGLVHGVSNMGGRAFITSYVYNFFQKRRGSRKYSICLSNTCHISINSLIYNE